MLYEINNLTRVRQQRTILDIPSLVLPADKIISLIGPNGAGKTTLLHLLAFLDIPSGGTISFRSTPVRYTERLLHPLRQQVVLVDQYPILFTGSVRKNLEFGLKVRNLDKKNRRQRLEEALALVGMERFINAEAHKLSGGETKRVALARALAVRPKVLLCDEPTANVDTENQEIIQNILAQANRKENISIIFATHSLSQVQRLADQTLTLLDGRLSEVSRANVLAATVIGRRGERIVCRVAGGVEITAAQPQPAGKGAVRLVLDPARLVLVGYGEPLPGQENVLPGTVVKIVAENGRIKITVDTGAAIDVMLSRQDYLDKPPVIGEQVSLAIPDQAISLE